MFRKVLVQARGSILLNSCLLLSINLSSEFSPQFCVFHYLECTLGLESIFAFDQSLRRLINFSIADPRLRQEIKYHE